MQSRMTTELLKQGWGDPRVLLAGPWSGSGKTTVTLAILSALKARGINIAAAKCGPDYVDPLFHREVLGIQSRNLDPYFLDQEALCAGLTCGDSRLTLIEGVMGYYDGVGPQGLYSTYQLAVQTQTPVVLVLPAKGIYQSLQALISGYKNFRPDSQIRGVIFNQASPYLASQLAEFAASQGLESLGVLPYAAENFIQSGRLGLDIQADQAVIADQIYRLGQLAEQHIDLDKLLALADQASSLVSYRSCVEEKAQAQAQQSACPTCVLALARDQAFNKIYPENIQILEEAGFQIKYFSPLDSATLPAGIAALYLPGGCPENFAEALVANQGLRADICQALKAGLPCWAEHGGMAYLYQKLAGQPMVGYLPGEVDLADRLQNFGYGSLKALKSNPLCPAGETLKCHEFHYYQASNPGEDFQVEKLSGKSMPDGGHAGDRLFASFAQLYLPAYPHVARRFYQLARTGLKEEER